MLLSGETMDDEAAHEAVPVEGDSMPVMPVKDDDSTPTIHKTKEEKSPGATQATASSTSLQNLADKALHFLSHASNETLGACLVGLGATTYLVLGRVGLVIIGVAGGVVLHATWEGIRNDDWDEETKTAERAKKRETGVEIAKRILDLRASGSTKEDSTDVKVYASQRQDYSSFDTETATALNAFTDAVIKDYVYYWYRPTLPGEESFPASCRRTLTAFILSLSGHLQRKRPADALLDFVTNASSILIVFLNELAAATNASPNVTPAEAIATYLRLKPDSSLAYMLDQGSQDAKLADASEDILQAYLDPKAYNCQPVHVFLKEVLAQLVLGSTITLCSRPEWINDWIVYGLEESKTTQEVMSIVDAGVEGRTTVDTSQDVKPRADQALKKQEIARRKESTIESAKPAGEHRRQMSRAEEKMDEDMREARRLTQLMIEEDERRAREEQEKPTMASSSEDVSDANTQGAPTPTSSQSDRDAPDDEATSSFTSPSQAASITESPTVASRSQDSHAEGTSRQQFTSFDQLVPPSQPTALMDGQSSNRDSASPQRPPVAPLTLHNANMSIFDDSVPGERGTSLKQKPTADYLIQIEPANSAYPGWMIARKYADFEMLHEVLRRISVVTGVVGFTESHTELPKWRTQTKANLRVELERYLTDAVKWQPLAESEGMKRFLEKDQGLNRTPGGGSKGFGWPNPDAFGKFGGDMMNVLTKAPKQVAGGVTGGGKAVFGGVAGLVGNVAGVNKRQSQGTVSRSSTAGSVPTIGSRHQSTQSMASLAESSRVDSFGESAQVRQSQESLRASSNSKPTFDRHASTPESKSRPTSMSSVQRSSSEMPHSYAAALSRTANASPAKDAADETVSLPPPPSEMPEDYGSGPKPAAAQRSSVETFRSSTNNLDYVVPEEPDLEADQPPTLPTRPKAAQAKSEIKSKEKLSESETSVTVELMFAVITELYTLSSAWNIRRTLLTAAKTFLLRPGNPQLLSIRDLLQTSLLDSNLNDAGLASHIYKLRENALPTEEEMEIWRRDYPEKNNEQKEELRLKARKLLVTKGMPQALSSVMGAAASGEALGKVFDCLQVPEVSRGLIFGLMVQALRVVTH